MQMVQGYAQQLDVAQRLQTDEAFAARLTKYMEQYQFMMQQAQNAQIGRIGTAPADLLPTGFLPVCSQYNYGLGNRGLTLGAASSKALSVRRKSLVAKSMEPVREGLKEVEAEVYLSG